VGAAVALATLSLAGCIGPTMKNKHPGLLELRFHNEAGGPVCKVFVYPFSQQEPSNNLLDADTEIPSGSSVDTFLEPGTYQINAQGCPYEKQQVNGFAPQVIMNVNGVAVLYKEDDVKSKEAAQAVVHDSHNGTMIPVKITLEQNPIKKPATVHAPRTTRAK
jgi:hypothetical protein